MILIAYRSPSLMIRVLRFCSVYLSLAPVKYNEAALGIYLS